MSAQAKLPANAETWECPCDESSEAAITAALISALAEHEPDPAPQYAQVTVRDHENAPHYVPGDILQVNMRINRFMADGLYVVAFAGKELVRYLRDQGDRNLQLFTGAMPTAYIRVTPGVDCQILGMVEAAGKVRRVA